MLNQTDILNPKSRISEILNPEPKEILFFDEITQKSKLLGVKKKKASKIVYYRTNPGINEDSYDTPKTFLVDKDVTINATAGFLVDVDISLFSYDLIRSVDVFVDAEVPIEIENQTFSDINRHNYNFTYTLSGTQAIPVSNKSKVKIIVYKDDAVSDNGIYIEYDLNIT